MGRKKTVIINPGEKHKDWLVIKEVEMQGKNRYFLCECLICHKEYEVQYGNLLSKTTHFSCKACAQVRRFELKADELVGKVFGRLTVISKHSVDKNKQWQYNCLCECGISKVILGRSLTSFNTTSCGCYRHEKLLEVNSGENSYLWKGGITPQNQADRNKLTSLINPLVRERDNYTCQNCSKYGGYLEVHHIFDFATYPELKFEESNLITLCKECHIDFHSIYPAKLSNTLDNLEHWMDKEYKYKIELLKLA